MADLKEVTDAWEQAAKDDPLFNILTEPGTEGGRWDHGDFFQRGVDEVAEVMENFGDLFAKRRKVLDFGCGVGRLTQALAGEFDEAVGVDASPEMVRLAAGFNKRRNVSYRTNAKPDLSLFPAKTFDGIYTRIVLQHMPAEYQRGYIEEFMRILSPGGLAVFDSVESGHEHPNTWLSMHPVQPAEIEEWLEGHSIERVLSRDEGIVRNIFAVRP